jgi:hypothetical protein
MRHFFKTGVVLAVLVVFGSLWAEVSAQDFIVNTAGQGAKRLRVTNSTGHFNVTAIGFTTLLDTQVEIPAGINQARIVARFSGESNCGGEDQSWCSLRIMVDGQEMNPAAGADYAFDSPGDIWSANSTERTSHILTSGLHTLAVQGALILGATEWVIDDWQLTLEVWRVS